MTAFSRIRTLRFSMLLATALAGTFAPMPASSATDSPAPLPLPGVVSVSPPIPGPVKPKLGTPTQLPPLPQVVPVSAPSGPPDNATGPSPSAVGPLPPALPAPALAGNIAQEDILVIPSIMFKPQIIERMDQAIASISS